MIASTLVLIWKKGCGFLEADYDNLDMCELVPTSWLIYIYSVNDKPLASQTPEVVLTHDYASSQDDHVQFVDNIKYNEDEPIEIDQFDH